jgi:hypothetical protein
MAPEKRVRVSLWHNQNKNKRCGMVDWGKALETFVVGFGGVFVTLIILYVGIVIFSKVVMSVTSMKAKKE